MAEKPKMKFDGKFWLCWSKTAGAVGIGVGKTMEEAWHDYHASQGWRIRSER